MAISLEPMLEDLRKLCALRSVVGDERALAETAEALAARLQQAGFQASVVETSGAPVVIADRAGQSSRRILFYDHYDIAPPGPHRSWSHDPFNLAERDDAVYARGVVAKGNIVARLGGVLAAISAGGELPVGVTFLLDGEGLVGSPSLPDVVASQAERLQADLVIGSGGALDAAGRPYLYAGVKGRLQVRVSVTAASLALPPDAASGVANAAWRLIWALARIKSDQEEVLIDGFYDDVEPVEREIVKLVRGLNLDEEGRLQAWGLQQFLFEMSGSALARTEILNPTCNVSLLSAGQGNLPALPNSASALLDFSLVPNQQPRPIFDQLRSYLDEHEMTDVAVELLPGAFPASRSAVDDPLVLQVVSALETAYGEKPQLVPLAPFTAPLHLFSAGLRVPAIALGLARASSALRAPDERLLVGDLTAMALAVAQLLGSFQNAPEPAAA